MNKEVREFRLPVDPHVDDEPGQEKFTVHTKYLGSWREVLEAGYRGGERCIGMEKLVSVFENMRVTRKTTNGTVTRKPRLLVCGGFVRDVLMGISPKDVDFATDATYREIQDAIREQLPDLYAENGVFLKETGRPGESFSVLRVIFPEGGVGGAREEYEVATFRIDGDTKDGRRPDSVDETTYAGIDARRRDLTVNALYYNVASGNVIDYVGGLKDIEEGRLRFVGDPNDRISEDTLRMFRYVRFLLRTGYSSDEGAHTAIRNNAEKVATLSAERIREEFEKMLHIAPGRALRELEQYGLLKVFLPEVANLRLCPQGPPYHMEGDVLEHTAMVCESLHTDMHERSLPISKELLYAAVLHDTAKPNTRREEDVERVGENGTTPTQKKVSFVGHDTMGADMVCGTGKGTVSERLRLSIDTRRRVHWLIENHTRVFALPRMKLWNAVHFIDHPGFDELLALARADMRSARRSDSSAQAKVEDEVETLMVRAEYVKHQLSEWKRYRSQISAEHGDLGTLNGHVLMQRYDLQGGPHLNTIKESIEHTLFRERPTDLDRILAVADVAVRHVCSSKRIPYKVPTGDVT